MPKAAIMAAAQWKNKRLFVIDLNLDFYWI